MNRQGYTGLESDLAESQNQRNRLTPLRDMNATLGYGGQMHLFALGAGLEVGGTTDTLAVDCAYIKVCGSVGPGLFVGGGPTAGIGTGNNSSGWQPPTIGGVVAGAWVNGASMGLETNTGGASASGSVRTRIDYRGGFGAVGAVTSCRQFNMCAAPRGQ